MQISEAPRLGGTPELSSPALIWREPAPPQFDLRIPLWVKVLGIGLCLLVSLLWLDSPVAAWAIRTHPIPDLTDKLAKQGDTARELMLLEQWGQVASSLFVIGAVLFVDKAGKRRALAILLACLVTLLVTHLLKDLFGRMRPLTGVQEGLLPGHWVWGGPARGFGGGAAWTSFPSAHTSAAFALSTALAWFYPRGRFIFMCLACITAALRVLHHAHFLSDVIAGMGLAVFVTRWTLHKSVAGYLIALMPAGVREWSLR